VNNALTRFVKNLQVVLMFSFSEERDYIIFKNPEQANNKQAYFLSYRDVNKVTIVGFFSC